MIAIDVIHVSNNLSPFLLNQTPVSITAKSQIGSAIIVTTDACPQIGYVWLGLGSTLTNIAAMTTKMTPTMAIAKARFTTTWVGTVRAWAKTSLGIGNVVLGVFTFRRHFQ
jgi:hypothetical protein